MAGEQFLMLVCMANVRPKGVFVFTGAGIKVNVAEINYNMNVSLIICASCIYVGLSACLSTDVIPRTTICFRLANDPRLSMLKLTPAAAQLLVEHGYIHGRRAWLGQAPSPLHMPL